jgi:predicted DNA-binding transcriptional regulator AlpA
MQPKPGHSASFREALSPATTFARLEPAAEPADPFLDVREGAAAVGISIPSFWRAVAEGRLPMPVYPSPRTPRWRQSELIAAVELTRAEPAQQKLARARAAARKAERAVLAST